MDSDVTRRHQRDKTPRWCRREHATTGADQTPGPRPVTLSSEGRPLLAVSGWCVVVCHCGGTGDRGLFAPQSTCPGSSWRQESHLPFTSTGCSESNATSLSVSARLARRRRYPVQQRLRYVRCWTVCSIGGRRAATTPEVSVR